MKKILFFSMIFVFMVSMLASAKVTIVTNSDGTYSAIITYKSDLNQANIIGSFNNWQKPGVPMTLNADGVWEYTLPIDAPMIKYKFFDPSISDDSAYLDDPEYVTRIANPFGSFDYLIKRPKPGATDGAPQEEEYNPVFGMWGRLYYNFQLFTDFGAKVVKDKNGKVVYVGVASGEQDSDGKYKSQYIKKYDAGDGLGNVDRVVVDDQVGFGDAANANSGVWKFFGENGTTDGDYSRIILGRDSFSISTTLKFHGKVSKYFQVDVEVNSQLFWVNRNEAWVWYGDKEGREEFWKMRVKNNASNFVSGLFGGLGREYVFPKQYYNNDRVGANSNLNSTPDSSDVYGATHLDNGSMHVDQVQFAWTADSFDIYISPAGGKNLYSKDPMSLISSTRIANTNYAQSSIQALIHPAAVKGLNFNLATTYSAATKNYSGNGWRLGPGNDGGWIVDASEVGRYIAAADIYYDILGLNKYTIGVLYSMSALGVPAAYRQEYQNKDYLGIDSFGNSVHQLSLWTELKPVSGLTIKAQGAIELDTKYFDQSKSNDFNSNYYLAKASYSGFDPLAHMADYISIGYKNKIIDISVFQAAAGIRFKGNIAEYGSMFAGYDDIWADDYANGIDGHSDYIGNVGGGLRFSVNPIASDPEALKLKLNYDVKAIGLSTPIFANASYRLIQEPSLAGTGKVNSNMFDISKNWSLRNSWIPGIESGFKVTEKMKMIIRASAEFRLDTYFGQALIAKDVSDPTKGVDVIDVSSNIFTFREFNLQIGIEGINDVLKAVDIAYNLRLRNHEPYYMGNAAAIVDPSDPIALQNYYQTQQNFDDYNNKWAFKVMHHMIGAEFRFAHDITFGAGYLFRYSHGAVGGVANSAVGSASMTANAEVPLIDTADGKVIYYQVPDYFSWGLAFQFKYVIPVKILKTPTLFVNLNMGWDPNSFYDPGYLETATFDITSTNYDAGTAADWSRSTHAFQMVNLTLGLQWDF